MFSREVKMLTLFLCLWLVVPPQLFATGVVPDGNAPTSNQPTIVAAPNGLSVVNIVQATPQGVSHNKYIDFNVDTEGLILNNSATLSQTQLAGYVLGNPNLNGNSARVILNEVTSMNPSHLSGYTEVAGPAADVIIANPNGISVNGAGFLNTPRVTLTTGIPVMNAGALERYRVEGGAVSIYGLGLNAASVDAFDIVSRAVDVNADLHARDLNLVLGRNEVDAVNLDASPLLPGAVLPEFSLDSSLLGGMYVDRIRLVGTEAGVGVRVAGGMAASVGDIVLISNGRIEVSGELASAASIYISGKNQIENSGAIVAADELSVDTSYSEIVNSGEAIAGSVLSISAMDVTNTGLIASAGRADLAVSNRLENQQGMIFAIDDLHIIGPNVQEQGLTLLNDGGTIESWVGNVSISAAEVFNRSEAPVVSTESYRTEGPWISDPVITFRDTGFCLTETGVCWRTKEISGGYVETMAPYNAPQARILAGEDISIEANTIANEYSLFSAAGDLNLAGNTLNNFGKEAIHQWTTTTLRYQWSRYHNSTHTDCGMRWEWRAPLVDGPYLEVLDGIYGTLEAGGNLSATFSEEIDNGKPLEGVVKGVASPLPDRFRHSDEGQVGLASGWDFLFRTAPIEQPYLIETRPEFANISGFVNSEYLLDQLGYSPDQNVKRLGDGHYELRLLREEVTEETGRRYLSDDYASEKEQFLTLMDNAVEVAPQLELEVGMALRPEQVEMLTNDIVWLVEEEVAGQKVLVPQLYLARVHDENIIRGSQIVADGDLALFGGQVENSGYLAAGGDMLLESSESITLHQGEIVAAGRVAIDGGTDVAISGGRIAGGEVNITAGEDVTFETLHQQNSFGQGGKSSGGRALSDSAAGYITVVGQAVEVASEGALTVVSGDDISLAAARLTGEDIDLQAGGDIEIKSVEDAFESMATFDGGYEKLERVRQIESRIEGDRVSFTADDDISIVSSTLESQGDLEIIAGDDLLVTSAEEVDIREFKKKQSSGFGSKTEFSRDESVRQVGSILSSGGNMVVLAGNDTDVDSAGDIDILASRMVAEGDLIVAASRQIDVGAREERTFSESYVKKSNAVRKKETLDRTDETTLLRAELSAGGNLVVDSGNDINIVAADISAEEMIVLSAGEDGSGNLNLLADNERTETLKYTRRSGIDLSISDDFASVASDKRHTYGTRAENTIATELAAGEIYLSAGTDINLIGAEVNSSGDLNVMAGRDANILNAVEMGGAYEEHREEKIGIAVDIDENSVGVFAGAQKEKDKIATNAQQSVGSSLQAGTDIVVVAGQDITQVGSDLAAGRDVILDAGGDIRSLASTDIESLYEYHEQLRVGFTAGLQHNLGSARDAAEGVDDSQNLVSGVSRTLKAVDAVNNATQPSFSTHFGVAGSESETERRQRSARVSTIVAGRDIDADAAGDVELQGTVAQAGRDVALAGENVRVLAAENSSEMSDETRTFKVGVTVQGSRNSGSASLGVSGSNSEFDQESENVSPVLLQAGQDVRVVAENIVEMEGAQLAAGVDIELAAGELLDIHAAVSSFASDSESYNYSAEVGMSASKEGVGSYVSAGGGQSNLGRDGRNHVNASVAAGGDMNILVGGDVAIRGANLEAENIRADIGGNLHVASVQDTGSADGERWNAGVTVGIGTASGVSGSYGETEAEKDWIANQTSIVARDELDIEVGNHTQLDAALIASESNNLRIETETLAYSDHYGVDRENSYDAGFGLSGIGGGPANQQSGAGVNDTDANWSVDGGYSNRDRRQTVRATIGDGEIIVRADADNGSDSTAGLNRDVAMAYEITKDESDSYEIYASENAIDSVVNYDDTLARWGHVALNYGRETVAAVKGVDYITDENEWAEKLTSVFDTLGKGTLGAMPSRASHGGWVTQAPVLLSGDMEFYKVVALLEKVQGAKEFELMADKLEFEEVDIRDPEQLALLLEDVDYASVNGIMNSLEQAFRNGAMQTGAAKFLQAYNPTHGLISDLVECLWDFSVGGIIKSGNARNLNEFYSLVDNTGESLKIASHSQGALLNYRALDGLSFQDKDWKFQFFGAPVYQKNLNEAVMNAKGENKGSYANSSHEEILGGIAYKNDFVSSIAGGNAGSVQEVWNGLMSFPSVIGLSRSDHSNYTCQGDFCAGQQPDLLNYHNRNTRLLQ